MKDNKVNPTIPTNPLNNNNLGGKKTRNNSVIPDIGSTSHDSFYSTNHPLIGNAYESNLTYQQLLDLSESRKTDKSKKVADPAIDKMFGINEVKKATDNTNLMSLRQTIGSDRHHFEQQDAAFVGKVNRDGELFRNASQTIQNIVKSTVDKFKNCKNGSTLSSVIFIPDENNINNSSLVSSHLGDSRLSLIIEDSDLKITSISLTDDHNLYNPKVVSFFAKNSQAQNSKQEEQNLKKTSEEEAKKDSEEMTQKKNQTSQKSANDLTLFEFQSQNGGVVRKIGLSSDKIKELKPSYPDIENRLRYLSVGGSIGDNFVKKLKIPEINASTYQEVETNSISIDQIRSLYSSINPNKNIVSLSLINASDGLHDAFENDYKLVRDENNQISLEKINNKQKQKISNKYSEYKGVSHQLNKAVKSIFNISRSRSSENINDDNFSDFLCREAYENHYAPSRDNITVFYAKIIRNGILSINEPFISIVADGHGGEIEDIKYEFELGEFPHISSNNVEEATGSFVSSAVVADLVKSLEINKFFDEFKIYDKMAQTLNSYLGLINEADKTFGDKTFSNETPRAVVKSSNKANQLIGNQKEESQIGNG